MQQVQATRPMTNPSPPTCCLPSKARDTRQLFPLRDPTVESFSGNDETNLFRRNAVDKPPHPSMSPILLPPKSFVKPVLRSHPDPMIPPLATIHHALSLVSSPPQTHHRRASSNTS
ncbi:Uncharacterized protein Rs2_02314 [Raphanus sativus]|nr:Uncharacterized protein Rs2_02314 [Raphanus sativus]